ncbi:MAG: protein-glutamate O-methyltransferase CheR [Spirochaetales bacterium]|nr:protein-glutamate O-methyltransferase CheR [Spirochaetales bacterium]
MATAADFLTDPFFEKFRTLIYDASGITFSTSNRPILESRLRERLRQAQLGDLAAYLALIQKNPEEMKAFLDSVTTNLTRFFRNQVQFDSLEHDILPDLVQYKRKKGLDRRVRIWSAGCSTGEEPYTLAMILKDKLPADFAFDVLASDLSLKSLMTAQQGFYQDAKMQGVPESYLSRFFVKVNDGYQIKDELKARVRFDYHNLKFDSGQRNIDVIFCRNVLIYFDEAAQKNVVDLFWQSLTEHSYFFIGHSESLFGMNTQFKFLKTDRAVLYTKILDA